jgi:hypothetical protein
MGELSAALRNAVGASSPIQHNLLKGELRERRVITGLRSFIPKRYTLSSGIIVNSSGDFSKQQDLVISDITVMPPFFAAQELAVHPIESISGTIEIKSLAKSGLIREAVNNVASVKTLAPDEPRDYVEIRGGHIGAGQNVDKPFGGIMFLDSEMSDDAILDEYLDATTTLAPNNRPNALVVVDRLTLSWGSYPAETSQLVTEPEPLRGTHVVRQILNANSLLVFYVILMRILASYKPPEMDIMNYVVNSGGYGEYELMVRAIPPPKP